MIKYLTKRKLKLFIAIILTLSVAFLNIFLAYVLKNITDSGVNKDIAGLKRIVIIGLIYLLIRFIVAYTYNNYRDSYIKKCIVDLRGDLFNHIITKNFDDFYKGKTSNYISMLNNDILLIQEDFFMNVFDTTYGIFSFIIASAAISMLHPLMALIIIAISLPTLLIPVFFGKKLETNKTSYSNKLAIYISKIKDYFTGFEIIKSFNIENQTKKFHNNENENVEDSRYKFNKVRNLTKSLSALLGFMIVIVVMGVSSYRVIVGTFTVGTMIAIVQMMNAVIEPIMSGSDNISRFKSVSSISSRMLNIIKSEPMIENGKELKEFNNSIIIKNLNFSYDNKKNILKDINLTLEKNKKYAVVGQSGSGKSTLVKILLKYYTSYTGNVIVDDYELNDIQPESYYKYISLIHQNVFMFEDTIKNNIMLYNDKYSANLDDAIYSSGIFELINKLPDGINTVIKENGNNFSGGEKQRFAIARALIRKTKILVLDEGTANLDNETAINIEKLILQLNDLMCIVITHRLSKEILNMYDEIIVLNDGKICEKGTFDSLMKKGGYFYSLYAIANGE